MRTLTLIILCISYAVAQNPGEYVLSHFITEKERENDNTKNNNPVLIVEKVDDAS